MRINHVFTLVILLSIALVAISGCRTSPVNNVADAAITSTADNGLTLDQVHDAIVRAGSGLGWRMKDVEPGHMVATLNVRSHMAQVDIHYDTDSYDIEYRDSRNLKYDGKVIHSNYNGWIQNLDDAIQNQLIAL